MYLCVSCEQIPSPQKNLSIRNRSPSEPLEHMSWPSPRGACTLLLLNISLSLSLFSSLALHRERARPYIHTLCLIILTAHPLDPRSLVFSCRPIENDAPLVNVNIFVVVVIVVVVVDGSGFCCCCCWRRDAAAQVAPSNILVDWRLDDVVRRYVLKCWYRHARLERYPATDNAGVNYRGSLFLGCQNLLQPHKYIDLSMQV